MTFATDRPGCESVQALIPEYVLGVLEPAEAHSVRSHARACAFCRREIGAYERVVGGLLLSPSLAAPSPFLKARVMVAAGAVSSPAVRDPLGVRLASALSLRGLVHHLSPAPAIVALAFLMVVGAASQLVQLQADLQAMRAENQSLRSELASTQGVVADALSPGAVVWQLSGTAAAPNARASLVCNPNGKTGILSAANLPVLPAGEAYQLWLNGDGERASGGLLTVDRSGRGVLTVQAPAPFGDYQSVGMTVEPATGSPGPTGQRVLSGQIYTAHSY